MTTEEVKKTNPKLGNIPNSVALVSLHIACTEATKNLLEEKSVNADLLINSGIIA